jgi:hypothetical protein
MKRERLDLSALPPLTKNKDAIYILAFQGLAEAM